MLSEKGKVYKGFRDAHHALRHHLEDNRHTLISDVPCDECVALFETFREHRSRWWGYIKADNSNA
jgi:hypothetical protein